MWPVRASRVSGGCEKTLNIRLAAVITMKDRKMNMPVPRRIRNGRLRDLMRSRLRARRSLRLEANWRSLLTGVEDEESEELIWFPWPPGRR